ncbi:hypothetical protein CLIB1444_06S00628 [[Candida] jaroonii]|uniref:Uncharacterized protein n=1 Tax=[Candida] jaroonii TaxID=467808 RepID=A0ACA9Y8Q6_9ASCO|nr:hypothetical protein CLIB1444_06S00628 [[Candida] jaroonii]
MSRLSNCLRFIRQSSTHSNSSVVVDSILKLSRINLNGNLKPLNLVNKSISFQNHQFPTHHSKSRELSKLGDSIIQFVSWRYESLNYPHNKHPVDKVPKLLYGRLKKRLESINTNVSSYVGSYYVDDPQNCLDNISSLLGDIKISFRSHTAGVPSINEDYLYYDNNEFTFPSLRDKELAGLLKAQTILGENLSHYGTSYYRFKVISEVYKYLEDSPLSLELTSFLLSDQYLKFLMERIEIFKLLNDDISKYAFNPDVYKKLFGRYMAILTINQPDIIDTWINNHIKIYVDIFDNLSIQECKITLKDLSMRMKFEYGSLDNELFRIVESFCKVSIPVDLQSNLKSDIGDDELVDLAYDFVSYCTGKYFTGDKSQISERNKKIVLDVFSKKQEEENVLRNLGIFITASKFQAETTIFSILGQSFKRPYVAFDPTSLQLHKFGIKIPQPYLKLRPNDSNMIRLLLINRHIVFSFLNTHDSLLTYRNISKFNDIIKNFELIGYSYYRYLININLMKSNLNYDQRRMIFPFLMKKTFKSYIFDDRSQLTQSINNKSYNTILRDRINNDKYLKIKTGSTGFNQYFALLDLLHPKYPKNYVSNLLINFGIFPTMTIFKPNDYLNGIIKSHTQCPIELNSSFNMKSNDLIEKIDLVNKSLESYYRM